MGLDGTIKRKDGEPLGSRNSVQQALTEIFPGIVFDVMPSGIDKMKAAATEGVEFPETLR